MDTMPANRFRQGFATMDRETVLETLPVRGKIPDWLSGTLIRNGPAKFEAGQTPLRHWFDGFAMLHRFGFIGGKVSYANRFLESRAYKHAQEHGRIGYREFATDPCRSLFRRIVCLFSPLLTDNGVVNVSKIEERFVALTELPLPVEFDPKTLRTLGVVGFDDSLKGQQTTAHPHYDPARGEQFNYLLRYSWRSTYTAYRLPRNSRRREPLGSIRVRYPSYMHSFAMTEKYLVFAAFPLVVDPLRLALGGRTLIENFRWEPERGTLFHVMRRDTGKLIGTYQGEPFFAFHHVNAFEKEGDLHLDIAAYDDASVVTAAFLDLLRGEPGRLRIPRGELRRYRLPLSGGDGAVARETILNETLELPRIDYGRRNGREYRFAYGVGYRRDLPDDFFNKILKVDVPARSSQEWLEEGCYPGEPVFVPAPDASEEDAGVLLSVVLDATRGSSFLLVLDARSLTELARAEVPHIIPFGFHGQHFGKN